jgi:hypothetical protein
MRRIALLLVLVAVAAGCGQTYSDGEVRKALQRAGAPASPVSETESLIQFYGFDGEGFPPLELQVNEFLFDAPRVSGIHTAMEVPGGIVWVFRSPHAAWEAEQGFAVIRRSGVPVDLPRARRRGNVLFFWSGRRPRLERAADLLA